MGRPRIVETRAGRVEAEIAGTGPPVLSIHGTPGGHGQAMAFAAHFREGGHQVIAPSRPAYGGTPLGSGPDFEATANLLAALLDELGVERTAVYAVSGGGATAFQLALSHPDRVEALVTEDVVTHALKATIRERVSDTIMLSHPVLALFAKQVEHDLEGAIAGMLGSISTLDKEHVQRVAAAVAARPGMRDWMLELAPNLAPRHPHHGYAHDIKLFAHLPEIPFERIETRALICHGEADSEVPVEHAHVAAERLPNAELYLVPEAGHILALSERGAEVQRRQLDFVAG